MDATAAESPGIAGPRVEATLTDLRLRSHRLTARAPSLTSAAEHMLAVQSQEFWGGRWALASRTAGSPTISDVDALFDAGVLVRSWTMRGTLHIVPARDLGWVLSITGERQYRQAASLHRMLGLDAATLARCETALVAALIGGNRLTRSEVFDILRDIGVDPADQRGVRVIYALAVRGLICQGPVVRRRAGPSREQYFVLVDEWARAPAPAPRDPVMGLFTRFARAHGPANAADFAWWSGLPLTVARRAAEASAGDLDRWDGDAAAGNVDARAPDARAPDAGTPDARRFVARDLPDADPRSPAVFALPPFEEYYLSYVDRDAVCAPEFRAPIGPGKNGMMRPILVAGGQVVGSWHASTAIGRHTNDPVPELLAPGAATPSEIGAALDRYRAFISG